jgi:hypothetical protein
MTASGEKGNSYLKKGRASGELERPAIGLALRDECGDLQMANFPPSRWTTIHQIPETVEVLDLQGKNYRYNREERWDYPISMCFAAPFAKF